MEGDDDMTKTFILCILDGVGLRNQSEGNAFKNAHKPFLNYLWNNYPHCKLEASGKFVGIPDGQMGNSEVGHTNIGAGRVVYQSLLRINKAIEDGSFYDNEAFLKAIDNCKQNNTNLHLLGLVSDGGVHSHINHLIELLKLCKRQNFDRVYIHALLDGRDTEPLVGPKYINYLQSKIQEIGVGKIITIGGRYYAMNRDRNWDLTHLAYDAIINGKSDIVVNNTNEAFEIEYQDKQTDEFMKPTVIESIPINNNDSMIMFNFRSDRMIQLLRCLKDPNFKEFEVKKLDLTLVTMTDYESNELYKQLYIAFKPEILKNTLGEYISNLGLKQLRLSEFEKNGHVTFYFSGCSNNIFKNEDRKIFERSNVFTYDEDPKMRSYDITKYLIDSIPKYDFIVVNYPNGDALGHTGMYDKAIEGVEHIDKCLANLVQSVDLNNTKIIITADHGNCENMIDPDGTPNKMHSTNLVPFIVIDKDYKIDENYIGKLADVAPTILTMMGLDIPKEMTGKVLVQKK